MAAISQSQQISILERIMMNNYRKLLGVLATVIQIRHNRFSAALPARPPHSTGQARVLNTISDNASSSQSVQMWLEYRLHVFGVGVSIHYDASMSSSCQQSSC